MALTRAPGLAVVAAAVAVHTAVTGAWPFGVCLGVLLAIAFLVPVRAPALARLLLHAVGAGLGLAGALMIGPVSEALPAPARGISGAALGAAAVGLLCRVPLGAPLSPPLFALASVVSCGMTKAGASYVVGVAVFVAALLRELGSDAGPRLRALDRARAAASLAGAAAGVALAVSLALLLPVAAERVRGWVMLGASPAATSGLSDGVRLGRATDIESSDEVVLRVRGDGPELLRGFVLTHYRAGRWSRAIAPRERTVSGLAAPAPPGPRIMLTPVGGGERYLLPLEASAVWLASDRAVVDQYGQWKAPRGQVAGPASFAVGRQQLIDPPGPSETAVPPDLAGPLAELARDWAPPGPVAERLARLVARLQTGFSYSLHSRRKTNGDPVLDFLLHERSGHCEFFASALALLARSIGVPARVVTGYRVHEQNRFGGYRVVRERDAHAWVEAFIDGRWTTYDATPPSFLEGGGRASIFSALTDWVRARWSESDPARALRRAAAVAVPGLGVWLLVRVARRRRTARPGPRPTDAPWPLADELLHALAQRGWPRQPAETLEAFSRRLRAVPAVATCADGLDAYARHRYGGVAPRLEVEARLGQALRTLRDAG